MNNITLVRRAIKQYGTKAAVAKRLKISSQRLHNWLVKGKLPWGWDEEVQKRLKVKRRRKVKRK